MTDRFERLISGILAIVAVVIAITFVHREFGAASGHQSQAPLDRPPERISNWPELLKAGILVGDSGAPVKVVEFADFECPFCRKFELNYRTVQKKFGKNVALVFIDFPLGMHRFAMPAARAAACAEEQGKFAEFHDLVFDKSDSLGLKSWVSYATDAGIRDTAKFIKCNTSTTPVQRVTAGLALATKLGFHGTPTVIINGWHFLIPPTDSVLGKAITDALAGKELGTTKVAQGSS